MTETTQLATNIDPRLRDVVQSLVAWAPNSYICQYGSRVYGVYSAQSDYDIIVVVPQLPSTDVPTFDGVDLVVHTEDEYHRDYAHAEPWAIEAHFLRLAGREDFILHDCGVQQPSTSIASTQLRRSISKAASHAWVKAKKKLIVEKDYNSYVAAKSLFHALRLLMFGIQISAFGHIRSYDSANAYWHLILQDVDRYPSNQGEEAWRVFDTKFRAHYKQLCSTFREGCPL